MSPVPLCLSIFNEHLLCTRDNSGVVNKIKGFPSSWKKSGFWLGCVCACVCVFREEYSFIYSFSHHTFIKSILVRYQELWYPIVSRVLQRNRINKRERRKKEKLANAVVESHHLPSAGWRPRRAAAATQSKSEGPRTRGAILYVPV